MPEYRVLKDGVKYKAPDIQTLKRWVREGRIKPHNQVYHPVLQKWLYIKDMAELEEDLKKTSTSKKSFARYFTLATTFLILVGFVLSYYGFKNGFLKVGFVGAYFLVFGIAIFVLKIRRNKKTFVIFGSLIAILILSNIVSFAWINRNVKIRKITGVRCSSCKKVFSADTTIISIPIKEKRNRDFIVEYKDTLCRECKEKLIQEADNLFKEGKRAYSKGDYEIARAKFWETKTKYSKAGEEIKNVQSWWSKASEKLAIKQKREEARLKEKLEIATRKAYERLARNAFLDKGWDIKVRVHGPKKKYITLTWVLIGDVFVHNFKKSLMCQEINNLGFTRIYFKDGFNYSKYLYWD